MDLRLRFFFRSSFAPGGIFSKKKEGLACVWGGGLLVRRCSPDDSVRLRRYSAKSAPNEGFFKANSTVAIKNPNLSPASYRLPFTSRAYIGEAFANSLSASVS